MSPPPSPPPPPLPPSTIHAPSSPSYAPLRTAYFNAALPAHTPLIITPTTTADVVAALAHARAHSLPVGVRSGGHLFPATSLLPAPALLLDVSRLNHAPAYDPATRLVSFGPGVRGRELSAFLIPRGRFFPHGHSPTVAMGGFLLAGGQGWFMRGWGASCGWLEEVEVVMPGGEVVRAREGCNEDVWWAVRGGGQAFFGVVTRFWGRTIEKRRVWHVGLVLDCGVRAGGGEEERRKEEEGQGGGVAGELLEWVMATVERTPRDSTDAALATFWEGKYDPAASGEAVRPGEKLLMVVEALAYTQTQEEAAEKLRAFEDVSEVARSALVRPVEGVQETTWEELFAAQDALNPSGNGERWQCDSILSEPGVERRELIRAILPAITALPSRRSIGCIAFADIYPDPHAHAFSLPQEMYIASMTCWTDPGWDARMRAWMAGVYARAEGVSCGTYIADFDQAQRLAKVMTDAALRKFLEVRRKWDPEGMFPGYKGVERTLGKGGGSRI